MSKYGNKPVYYDTNKQVLVLPELLSKDDKKRKSRFLYFASMHEYRVFELLSSFDFYRLRLQHKIELIPPNKVEIYPKGKYWTVDFMVETKGGDLIPIEAKGTVMRDFPLILALLEMHKPYLYQNLWIVFPKKIPTMLQTMAIQKTTLCNRLTTIKEFPIDLGNKLCH